MKIDLSKYENPKIIQKDGKLQIYDKLKGIYRVVSPDQRAEEYVRQKVIEYLKHDLNINYQAMDIEESEAHYHDNNQRMDLLVSGMSDKKELLMVVECKAETVELTEDVYVQAKGYAERLNIPVIMVTNGLEADFLKKDENNCYEQIIKPPTYEELLDYPNIKTQPIQEYSYNRYTYEELFDETIQKQEIYKDFNAKTKAIHIDTKKNLIPYILNLRDCLLDTSHTIQHLNLGKYEFIKDLGVFYRKVDNTGGKFVGNYRSLLVKINNNLEIIDLKITPYFTESGRSDTVMMIALNGAEIQWIRFDRFGVLNGDIFNFYDDGATSTRNKGPIKRNIILDYIRNNSNLNISNNMVELGQIRMNKLIYADNSEFQNFLGNCIKYALLKQEKREEYQQNYTPKPKDNEKISKGVQKNHINNIIKKINVRNLSDKSMDMLLNHLNNFSIEIMDYAVEEAEKVNHKSISSYDFSRSLYNISTKNEKVTIFGEEYDSILEYMKECTLNSYVEMVLWDDNLKQFASEHEYEGIYTFILEYPSSKQVIYYFVFVDIFEDEDGDEIIELAPVYLPDVEIFKYLDDDNEEPLYANLTVVYESYSETNYQTNDDELVDFYANVRPKKDNELYVSENNINYLVTSIETVPLVKTKEELDELNLLTQMESDNFKGIYCEEYVYNTGEYVVEDYYIKNTDDTNVYFEDNLELKRNCNRIPSYIPYDEDESKGYLMVKNYVGSEYITSEELENLEL